jgi:hypothetical protein
MRPFLLSAKLQTQQWRSKQKWFKFGRKNECEKYQRKLFQKITKTVCEKTDERIHLSKHMIVPQKTVSDQNDTFEWTENFDGKIQLDKKTMYINFKFICSPGGSQMRSLRELYHFIKAQSFINVQDTYFINILDGEMCHRYLPKLKHATRNKNIFIGDSKSFKSWWSREKPN